MSTAPVTPALKNPQSVTPHDAPQSTVSGYPVSGYTVPGSTGPADTAQPAAETTVGQDDAPSATPKDPPAEPGTPGPRLRKDALLPEVARMTLEGYSNRAIGMELGVPRRTLDRWIQELRRQWSARAKGTAAEMFSLTVARLESVFREAIEACCCSKADKQVRLKPAAEGSSKTSGSIRTKSQSGQAALLGKAMQAALAICKVEERHLEYRREKVDYDDAKLADLLEEIENLTEEEGKEIMAMYRAKHPEWRSHRDKDGQPVEKQSPSTPSSGS